MSKANQIGAVIAQAIDNTPDLSTKLDSGNIYMGLAPAGVLPAITIDGTFDIDAKQPQRSMDIHLWMPVADPAQAGDILDLADTLRAALKGTAILTSAWVHQPDTQNKVDHVRIPSVVYLDLL